MYNFTILNSMATALFFLVCLHGCNVGIVDDRELGETEYKKNLVS
jgi:hypothetical protein